VAPPDHGELRGSSVYYGKVAKCVMCRMVLGFTVVAVRLRSGISLVAFDKEVSSSRLPDHARVAMWAT
jgi:hypothetical protein